MFAPRLSIFEHLPEADQDRLARDNARAREFLERQHIARLHRAWAELPRDPRSLTV